MIFCFFAAIGIILFIVFIDQIDAKGFQILLAITVCFGIAAVLLHVIGKKLESQQKIKDYVELIVLAVILIISGLVFLIGFIAHLGAIMIIPFLSITCFVVGHSLQEQEEERKEHWRKHGPEIMRQRAETARLEEERRMQEAEQAAQKAAKEEAAIIARGWQKCPNCQEYKPELHSGYWCGLCPDCCVHTCTNSNCGECKENICGDYREGYSGQVIYGCGWCSTCAPPCRDCNSCTNCSPGHSGWCTKCY